MEWWLLWGALLIVGSGGFVYFFYRIFCFPLRTRSGRLVLVTRNNQGTIEWIVRSFFFWRRVSGKSDDLICLDAGSLDDTGPILLRLEQRYPGMKVCLYPEDVPEQELKQHTDRVKQDTDVWDLRNLERSESS
ncbi:hypothetical protein [Desmospora activa]|uniref:Glycosyl transferase family 2 n=1 Tax=Desmospora activa DSM 45169 TaxID=1121389 RepID=A0A2T4Z495_9BACL|nr:hypothetical protein [Desmospora activa]PTM56704.1 hypothetical protein C8J48_3029 [Desmospora activa DSM 45169]